MFQKTKTSITKEIPVIKKTTQRSWRLRNGLKETALKELWEFLSDNMFFFIFQS